MTVHGDNEFRKIENDVGTHVNICAALQHIRRIERATEHLRSVCNAVGYPYLIHKHQK